MDIPSPSPIVSIRDRTHSLARGVTCWKQRKNSPHASCSYYCGTHKVAQSTIDMIIVAVSYSGIFISKVIYRYVYQCRKVEQKAKGIRAFQFTKVYVAPCLEIPMVTISGRPFFLIATHQILCCQSYFNSKSQSTEFRDTKLIGAPLEYTTPHAYTMIIADWRMKKVAAVMTHVFNPKLPASPSHFSQQVP